MKTDYLELANDKAGEGRSIALMGYWSVDGERGPAIVSGGRRYWNQIWIGADGHVYESAGHVSQRRWSRLTDKPLAGDFRDNGELLNAVTEAANTEIESRLQRDKTTASSWFARSRRRAARKRHDKELDQ